MKKGHTYFKKYHTTKIISYIEALIPVGAYRNFIGDTNETEVYIFIKDLVLQCNEKELNILRSIMCGKSLNKTVEILHISKKTYYIILNKFRNFFNTGNFCK